MDNINAPATPNNQNVTLPMNEFLELKLQQAQRSHQNGVPPAQGQATGMGMAVVPPHGWPPGPGPMPIATAVPWHAGNNQMPPAHAPRGTMGCSQRLYLPIPRSGGGKKGGAGSYRYQTEAFRSRARRGAASAATPTPPKSALRGSLSGWRSPCFGTNLRSHRCTSPS